MYKNHHSSWTYRCTHCPVLQEPILLRSDRKGLETPWRGDMSAMLPCVGHTLDGLPSSEWMKEAISSLCKTAKNSEPLNFFADPGCVDSTHLRRPKRNAVKRRPCVSTRVVAWVRLTTHLQPLPAMPAEVTGVPATGCNLSCGTAGSCIVSLQNVLYMNITAIDGMPTCPPKVSIQAILRGKKWTVWPNRSTSSECQDDRDITLAGVHCQFGPIWSN